MKFWTLFKHLWSFKTSKLLKKIYTFNFQRTWILTENVDDTEINLTKNKIFRNLLRIIFWSKSTISPFAEFYVKRNLSIRNICVQVPSSFNAVLQQRVAPTRQQVSNPLPIPTKSNHHIIKSQIPPFLGCFLAQQQLVRVGSVMADDAYSDFSGTKKKTSEEAEKR